MSATGLLSERGLPSIVARLDEEREAFGSGYLGGHGKLMRYEDGRPVHADSITRRFNRLVDKAGVRRIRLHDVRHTYATLLLDVGVQPKIVSDRMGHANMSVTFQIYGHRSTGRDREAADFVGELMQTTTSSSLRDRHRTAFGHKPGHKRQAKRPPD